LQRKVENILERATQIPATPRSDEPIALERRLAFLTDAATMLGDARNLDEILARVRQLALPALADFVIVDLGESTAARRRVLAAHCDPNFTGQVAALPAFRVTELESSTTSRAGLIEKWTAADLGARACTASERGALTALGPAQIVVLPLTVRAEELGWLILGICSPLCQREGEADGFFLDLARATAQALGHFRRYETVFQSKNASHALRDNESRFRAIVEHSQDAIFIKNCDGAYILMNQVGAAMFGMRPDEVVGQTDAHLFALDVSVRMREEDLIIMASRAPMMFEEEALSTSTGEFRLYLTSKVPYIGAAGEVIGVIGIARDITDRRRLEAAASHALEVARRRELELAQAKELEQLKDGFLGSISHELRTPLTSVMGYLEFLEDDIGGSLTEMQRGFVREIQLSTERVTRLVDDLLDFAQLEAGTFHLIRAEAELAEIVRDITNSVQPQARHAEITLTIVPTTSALNVQVDAHRIGQVLINYVQNAIKFTPRGGEINVRACECEGSVRCEVSDSGEGIAAKDLPRLFQRFTQLEHGRSQGGAGLGLSISKAIIEAHGGTVGVESELGKGSTFWFELPLSA
jgi:PAS domain S-box-containing protein